jgi:hypothetical protein
MNIDYNAVIEILKNFLNNDKIEILGISVGEERQVKEAIKNLLISYEEKNKELEKEKEKNKNAKWYIHQEVVRIMEDIEDYIDDDKEGNKHIIGEFKEDLKQWQDVEKLLDGKTKDELYIDWRKYGEYE